MYGQMNEPPGARARVALSGLTVAEYFRDQEGQDVLLFIDNIFRFTQAGSEVTNTTAMSVCISCIRRDLEFRINITFYLQNFLWGHALNYSSQKNFRTKNVHMNKK